jgi:hypothetical protein
LIEVSDSRSQRSIPQSQCGKKEWSSVTLQCSDRAVHKPLQKDLTLTHRIDNAITGLKGGTMVDDRTICVICAWRQTCNKKFSMDGSTTTRCPDYTRDVTLKEPEPEKDNEDELKKR